MAETKNRKTTAKKPSTTKTNRKEKNMNSKKLGKFAFLAGIILAVVIAIWPEPTDWSFWLLIILGLVGGYLRVSKASESHFILLAIGLSLFGGIIGDFPTLGTLFVDIFDGLNSFLGSAVIAVVVRNIIGWFRQS